MNTTDLAISPPVFDQATTTPLLIFVPSADGRGLDPVFLPGLRLLSDELLRELGASGNAQPDVTETGRGGDAAAIRDALGVIAAAADGYRDDSSGVNKGDSTSSVPDGGAVDPADVQAAVGTLNDAVARVRDGADDGALESALSVAQHLGGNVGALAGAVLARASDDDINVADALARTAFDTGLAAALGPVAPALAEALFGDRIDDGVESFVDFVENAAEGVADAAGDLFGGIGDALGEAAEAVSEFFAGDDGADGDDGAGDAGADAAADGAESGGETAEGDGDTSGETSETTSSETAI